MYAAVTIHFTHSQLDADFSHVFTWLGRKGTDSGIVKAAGVKHRARIKDTYQIEKGNKLDHLLPYFLSIINQIHSHF